MSSRAKRRRKKNREYMEKEKTKMTVRILKTLTEYCEDQGINILDEMYGRIVCESFGEALLYSDNHTGRPILELRRLQVGKGPTNFLLTKCEWGEDLNEAKETIVDTRNGEVVGR